MAISGLQPILVGLQNESTGSDSLYTAFTKTKNNFENLFGNASPFNTFTGGTGITINANSTAGTVDIINTGVTNVSVTSTNLTITGSPVTSTGTLTVNLPSNVVVAGQLILNGSENLASSSAVNVAVTASYFSTVTASTATLAIGTAGQIKTFMMLSSGGNMVITVTNPGWRSSGTGTMTFSNTGDACTLQYIASKWFCVGNNGAIFA
jgi:hypothetical protein